MAATVYVHSSDARVGYTVMVASNRTQEVRRQIAAAINPAIDDVLANGPGKRVDVWSARIRDVLQCATDNPREAAAQMRSYYHGLFREVVKNRGFRFVSVLGGDATDEPEGDGPDQFPPAQFAAIRPKLSEILEKCCDQLEPAAERFKSSWISDAILEFQDWAAKVPIGGTTDKSFRAEARTVRETAKSLAVWVGKGFAVHHTTDFLSATNHLFACAHGAIAGKWHHHAGGCSVHSEIADRLFFQRGSSAMLTGYLDRTKCRYFDEVDVPGSNGCLCSYDYVYDLRDVPTAFLTMKGRTMAARKDRYAVRAHPDESGIHIEIQRVPWWKRILTPR